MLILRPVAAVLVCVCLSAPQTLAQDATQQDIITQDVAGLPFVTATKHHKPGDPINLGLVGSKDEIIAAMQAAGWTIPVPVTLKSSVKIAGSVALHRTYLTAPVSILLYQGHKQDLAFEKQVGASASKRHHVRFWKLRDDGPDGRALWLGAATFDKGVGLSHRNPGVTHRIDGDVDKERRFLMSELNGTSHVAALYTVKGNGPVKAKNGGGDVYFTDGDVAVAVVKPTP